MPGDRSDRRARAATELLIAAELILIAAELNVVLERRLWPRSLTGELLEADTHALRDAALAAQLDTRQHIAVTFDHAGARSNVPDVQPIGDRDPGSRDCTANDDG